MSNRIAETARNYEQEMGHEITYTEMVCNQFVVAVLRRAVDSKFPMIKADDFPLNTRFRRVEQPQAGDLVHWPGHIGIVLDPIQCIFVGSQSSTGVAQANYKQGFWGGDYGGSRPDVFLRYID